MIKKHNKSKTKRTEAHPDLSAGALDALADFADQVKGDSNHHESVRRLAESLQLLIKQTKQMEAKAALEIDTLKRSLALSMRITPSSERMAAQSTEDPSQKTEAELRRKLNRARQLKRFAGEAEARLKDELAALAGSRAAALESSPDSDGQGCSAASKTCESGGPEKETVFSRGLVLTTGSARELAAPVAEAIAKGCLMSDVTRDRDDLTVHRNRITFRGKTAFDPVTGQRFDYDFSLVGPPGSCFTWRACLFVVLHVIGQASPLARLERMLGGKPYTRQNMHRIIGYVAKVGLPVYLQLAQELAGADVLSGDDTHSRVVEVNKALADDEAPWATVTAAADPLGSAEDVDNPDGIEPDSGTVFEATVADLGYRFAKVRDAGRFKDQHVTSCLHGIVEGQSRIVFYRSHLGSLGNLLDRILLWRKKSRKNLTLVADLSSANKVRDANLLEAFTITYAGCSAHARRPFFRHAKHRLDDCLEILDYFKMISILEDQADSDKVRRLYRCEHEYGEHTQWARIRGKCQELTELFSDQHPLGKAARYVLRNYEALTLYLHQNDLPATNNLSERLLRIERLSERNTYGSKTIEGRTRLDILRTLLTTCRYAGLDEATYLLKLMITPQKHIVAKPQNFTPSAIKALLEANPVERELLNKILHTENLAELVKPSSNFQRKANQDA
jgi:hypothetical protein